MDQHGRSWTVILHPVKRQVGGSTPPLTTVLICGDALYFLVFMTATSLSASGGLSAASADRA